METINGPIVPNVTGDLIYQITLASGMIITNPSAFGDVDSISVVPLTILSEAGNILSNVKFVDYKWERRQAEAIADLKEGRSTVYQTGDDFLAAMDKAIAKHEARNGK